MHPSSLSSSYSHFKTTCPKFLSFNAKTDLYLKGCEHVESLPPSQMLRLQVSRGSWPLPKPTGLAATLDLRPYLQSRLNLDLVLGQMAAKSQGHST